MSLKKKAITARRAPVAQCSELRSKLQAYLHACACAAMALIVKADMAAYTSLCCDAGCKEVWEFLSAWSELYGLSTEGGFLRSVSAKIQGANTSMRRCLDRSASHLLAGHLLCGHSSCFGGALLHHIALTLFKLSAAPMLQKHVPGSAHWMESEDVGTTREMSDHLHIYAS